MGDPFRDELIEDLELYLGHRLMAPEGIHEQDLKAIVEEMRDLQDSAERAEKVLEDADYDEWESDTRLDEIDDLKEKIDELKKTLQEVSQ